MNLLKVQALDRAYCISSLSEWIYWKFRVLIEPNGFLEACSQHRQTDPVATSLEILPERCFFPI